MKSKLEEIALKDITSIIKRGVTPRYVDENGILVVNQKCIRDGKVSLELARQTSKEKIPTDKLIIEHDVLVNSTGVGTLGRVAQIKKEIFPLTVDSHVTIVRPKYNCIEPIYFGYLVKSLQSEIEGLGEGSTGQTELSRIRLGELKAKIIKNKSEQKKIAHILSTLDIKIELNKKINQNLEFIAQTIFKSWFVDFDPVNAKADANSEDEYDAISKELGISREILDLFPNEFEETELGLIPKGWEVIQLSKISKLNPKSWNKKNFPHTVNYIDLTNVKEGNITEISEYTYATAPSRARRILEPHDTIIGTVRPGNKSYTYIDKEGLTGSTGFAVIRPLKEHYRALIYLYLTQESVIANLAHIADGGAYPAIHPEMVISSKLCKPSEDILISFKNKISGLFDKISQNKEEQRILINIRDILLPKLISGEIEVSNLNLEPEHD